VYQRDDICDGTLKKPLPLELVKQHLVGPSPTLGAYSLNTENQVKWLYFDRDEKKKGNYSGQKGKRVYMMVFSPFLTSPLPLFSAERDWVRSTHLQKLCPH
jgi:hypothetical protein